MSAEREAARTQVGTDHDMYLNPVVPSDVGVTEVPLGKRLPTREW